MPIILVHFLLAKYIFNLRKFMSGDINSIFKIPSLGISFLFIR